MKCTLFEIGLNQLVGEAKIEMREMLEQKLVEKIKERNGTNE